MMNIDPPYGTGTVVHLPPSQFTLTANSKKTGLLALNLFYNIASHISPKCAVNITGKGLQAKKSIYLFLNLYNTVKQNPISFCPSPVKVHQGKSAQTVRTILRTHAVRTRYNLKSMRTLCAPAPIKPLASPNQAGYAGVLSNSLSVPPQRHCGFFAPVNWLASQAKQNSGVSVPSHTKRLYSVYDGMTRPNKPMANKSGASKTARVNPVTLNSQLRATSQTQIVLGGNHA